MVGSKNSEKNENRESDEGVSQAPDWPYPGKTAKSASPIASPGQGVHSSMHVWDHVVAALPDLQVIDLACSKTEGTFLLGEKPIRTDSSNYRFG
jgi:hypothetical protein